MEKTKQVKIELTNGKVIYADKVVLGLVDGHLEGEQPKEKTDDGVNLGIIADGNFSLRELGALHHHLDIQLTSMGQNLMEDLSGDLSDVLDGIMKDPEKMDVLTKGFAEIIAGLDESFKRRQ